MSVRTKLPAIVASVLIASTAVLPAAATAAPADTSDQGTSVTEAKKYSNCFLPGILDLCV